MMFSFCKPTVCIAVMLMCAWEQQWNSPPKNLVLVGGHLVCGITPTGTSWIFNSYRPVLYVSSNIHGKQTHDLWLATNTLDKTWCRISFFGMINEFPILNIKIKNTKAKKYIQAQQKKKSISIYRSAVLWKDLNISGFCGCSKKFVTVNVHGCVGPCTHCESEWVSVMWLLLAQ